jgi:phosphoenolpyruvate synthase/pyruvate phosphate dikinase
MDRDTGQRARHIAWLGSSEGSTALLGGKAASIDRLLRLGIRTPPAFCLTTEAFRSHLLDGPLAGRVQAAFAALPDEGARASLVTLVTGERLGLELAAELSAGLDRLRFERRADPTLGELLAVRSSAVGEDSATSSYAGMHDTELGVADSEVEAAVKRCWASLWSERAVEYRLLRKLPLHGEAMAVVVQVLVPARAAAVVFTRHPVTGRTDQVLVEAALGFGEAIVSGEVTPDSYLVDKVGRTVLQRDPGGRAADGDALTDDQLHDLVTLSLSIEERYGAPVDIEAAHAGGHWYILQARPITTH